MGLAVASVGAAFAPSACGTAPPPATMTPAQVELIVETDLTKAEQAAATVASDLERLREVIGGVTTVPLDAGDAGDGEGGGS